MSSYNRPPPPPQGGRTPHYQYGSQPPHPQQQYGNPPPPPTPAAYGSNNGNSNNHYYAPPPPPQNQYAPPPLPPQHGTPVMAGAPPPPSTPYRPPPPPATPQYKSSSYAPPTVGMGNLSMTSTPYAQPPPPRPPPVTPHNMYSSSSQPPPTPVSNQYSSSGHLAPPATPSMPVPPPRGYPNSSYAPPLPPPSSSQKGAPHLAPPRPPPPRPNTSSSFDQQDQNQQARPKIEPSQIPRPPLFLSPTDGNPVPIYDTLSAMDNNSKSRPQGIGAGGYGLGTASLVTPPPADSRYLVNDSGNASPQLIRSTVYNFPKDRGIWHKMGECDIGVLLSPLALPSQDYSPTARSLPPGPKPRFTLNFKDPQSIPLIGTAVGGASGQTLPPPPRCRVCHAYMNHFWDTKDGKCNMCGAYNNPCPVDPLVLQKGSVDYEVDGPYITRSRPVEPIFLYAIDMTCPNLRAYIPLLQQIGEDLHHHFAQQKAATQSAAAAPPRIGVCWVSSLGVTVFARNKSTTMGGDFTMFTMPDITEDPFCHLPIQEWTFDVSGEEGVLEWCNHLQNDLIQGDLLVNLRKEVVKKNSYGKDGLDCSCMGAAMSFLTDALQETGGRATALLWRRPNFGVGKIRHRPITWTPTHTPKPGRKPTLAALGSSSSNDRKSFPFTPLQCSNKWPEPEDNQASAFYKDLGERCNKYRVAMDIMVHTHADVIASNYLDLATLSEMCRISTGKLSWIVGRSWEEPMLEELRTPILAYTGWDTILKVRCSKGFQVKSYLANPGVTQDVGGLASSPELELTCVTPQTSIAVLLEHKVGGIPKDNKVCYIQSALLYSTLTGQRRVRVSTLAICVSDIVMDVFLGMDMSALNAILLRKTVMELRAVPKPEDSVEIVQRQTRKQMVETIVKVLASYRMHTGASKSPLGQLILPEKLQLLPLFCMCLFKSPMMRPNQGKRVGEQLLVSPSSDDRAYYMFHAAAVGPAASFLLVHPNVFPVGNLHESQGEWFSPPIDWRNTAMSTMVKGSFSPFIQLPPASLASMTIMQDDGIYIVDAGLVIYILIGKQVSSPEAIETFDLTKQKSRLSTATEYGKKIARLIWQMKSFSVMGSNIDRLDLRPVQAPVIVVKPTDSIKVHDVMNWMVDDPNGGEKDYVDFLCSIHRRIREKIEKTTARKK